MSFSLDITILQLMNGDLFFNTSSDNPTLYENKCANSIADGGDYYLINSNLKNFTDYSMFSDDYSLLQTGLIDDSNSAEDTYKIKIAMSSGTFQPTKFILRIFNSNSTFKESFILKGGNTGVYFDNANTFFILSEDLQFTSNSVIPILSPPSNLYRNLFYILLGIFIFSIIIKTITYK